MRVRKKIKAVAVTILVIGCGFTLFLLVVYVQARKAQSADWSAFNVDADRIERELPPGTSRAQIEAYAATHGMPLSIRVESVALNVRKIHSAQWYCGSWIGELEFDFDSAGSQAKRTSAKRSMYGGDCL